MENDIEKSITQIIQDQTLEKVNQHLYLTRYQQQVLEKYHIPYQECQNYKELFFFLSDILDEEELDELEEVAREISERDYYSQK